MPLFSSCCFFFDLKVGTKVIGVIKLIGAIFSSITLAATCVFLLFLETGTNVASPFADIDSRNNFNEDDDYMDTRDQPKNMLELVKEHLPYVQIALYIVLALSILSVVTSSMMIHGVRRDRRGLLLPYIVQELLNIIIFIALDISTAVLFGVPQFILAMVLGFAVGCLVELYFLLVVISQYQALGLLRMHEEISMK